MAYKVLITPPAKRRLDMYVGYTAHILKNPQAARSILSDAKEAKKRLSEIADTLQLCNNPILAKYGYRKIRFVKHQFVMLYRIDNDKAIVDGMFHELQDYESTFINETNLN